MATSSGDPPASDDECIVGCETDDSDVIIGDHSDSSDGDNCDGGHSDGGDSDSNAIMDSDGSNVVADDDEEVQLPIAYISRHMQIMCVFAYLYVYLCVYIYTSISLSLYIYMVSNSTGLSEV